MASVGQPGRSAAEPMLPAKLVESVQTKFNGQEYLVVVTANDGDSCCIGVEQIDEVSTWRGDFTARYIEDITAKTGNFKKYGVFLRMLIAALRRESDSVFVDLLTYSDLEVLKNRRNGAPSATQPQTPSTKRYLILTYAAEFDRVHYPLPLVFDEHPDPEQLKSTIKTLRRQLNACTDNGTVSNIGIHSQIELTAIRDENAQLRKQLNAFEQGQVAAIRDSTADQLSQLHQELKKTKKERELLLNKCSTLESELEQQRTSHRRELRRKMMELEALKDNQQTLKEQLRELKAKCIQYAEDADLLARRQHSRETCYRPRGVLSDRADRGTRGPSPSTSLASSYRPSPNHSRDPSPTLPRPSARGGTAGARSRSVDLQRPGSAPRFDPTEYIKRKRERERLAQERLKRFQSPPSSRHSSAASTPTRSRAASIERNRERRPPSVERPRMIAVTGLDRQPSLPKPQPAIPSRSQRATSPGRALQDVKARLVEMSTGQRHVSTHSYGDAHRHASPSVASAAGPPLSTTASPVIRLQPPSDSAAHMQHPTAGRDVPVPGKAASKDTFDDAAAEIADLDSRLHALQDFLKAAKHATVAAV